MARTTVYNKVVEDGNYELVNEENKELLNEFVDYLHSIDRSDLTVKNYISDIKIFYIWNLEHNKNKFFVNFTKRDMVKFQNHMLNSMGLSSNRIRRIRASLSSMSNFIEAILDEDFPQFRNIINKIPAPAKNPVREKTILTDNQVQELLDLLVEKNEFQQACALALAWSTGSRKSELLRFKVDFFSDENIVFDSLYKTPKISTKGRGKNGKLLNKYVLLDFKKYFDLWMEERDELGIDSEWLFVTKQNSEWKQMKISTLNSWAITFSKILNVDFYFHSLRHQLCTRLHKLSLPQDIIQEYFGWDSAEMLKIYNDMDLSEEFGKYFTKDGIIEGTVGNINDISN